MADVNIFASLLDGVSRYYVNGQDDSEGYLLDETEVLAALAAAVPADLAEAGKVLEGVTPGPWIEIHGDVFAPHRDLPVALVSVEDTPDARFIAWCREGVPALLARIAAQEAQIKGHQDHVDTLNEVIDMSNATAQTLETALAAERAKVAKLVETLDAFPADWRERAHRFKGLLKLQAAWADGFNAARAAITEAGQ